MPYGANPIAGAGLSWMLWITHKIEVLLIALTIPHAREVLTERVRVILRVSYKHATSNNRGETGISWQFHDKGRWGGVRWESTANERTRPQLALVQRWDSVECVTRTEQQDAARPPTLSNLTGRRFFRSLPLKGATLYSQFTIAASFFLSCLDSFVMHGSGGVRHAWGHSTCREAFVTQGGVRHA